MGIVSGGGGGGGGGGALALISTTTLSGAGSFDISSIPGSYNDLVFVAICRGTNAAASEGLQWNFNNDSGSNYYSEKVLVSGTGALNGVEVIGTIGLLLGRCPGNTGLANSFGVTELVIPGYASTTWIKPAYSSSFSANTNTTTNVYTEHGGGVWNSTVAVTRVQVKGSNTANLAIGSVLRIYGRT